MDWFLYNGHLRHEKVELKLKFHLTHFRPIFPISITPSEKWVKFQRSGPPKLFFLHYSLKIYIFMTLCILSITKKKLGLLTWEQFQFLKMLVKIHFFH